MMYQWCLSNLALCIVLPVAVAVAVAVTVVLCYWGWKRHQRQAILRTTRLSLRQGIRQATSYLSTSVVPDSSSQLVAYTSSKNPCNQRAYKDGESDATEQRVELLVRCPGNVDHHAEQLDHSSRRINHRTQQVDDTERVGNCFEMDHNTDRMNLPAERMDHNSEIINCRSERMDNFSERINRRAERMDNFSERINRRAERMDNFSERINRHAERMDRSTPRMDHQRWHQHQEPPFSPVSSYPIPPVPNYPPPPVPDFPPHPVPDFPPPPVPELLLSPVQRPVRMKRNAATRRSRSRRPQLTYYHSIKRKPATLPTSLKVANEKDLLGMPYKKTKYRRKCLGNSLDSRRSRKPNREVNDSFQFVNWEYNMNSRETGRRSHKYTHERKKSGRITKKTGSGFKRRLSTRSRNQSPFPHLDPRPSASRTSTSQRHGGYPDDVAIASANTDNYHYVSGSEVSQSSTPQPIRRSWDHQLHLESNTQPHMLPLPSPPVEPPHVVAHLLMHTQYIPRRTPRVQVDSPTDDNTPITAKVQQSFGLYLRPPGEPMVASGGGFSIRQRSLSQETCDGGSRSSSPKLEVVTTYGSSPKFENDYHL